MWFIKRLPPFKKNISLLLYGLSVLLVSAAIGGWWLVKWYHGRLELMATVTFQQTELEIAREAARGVQVYVERELARRGEDALPEIERDVIDLFVKPIQLLEQGTAWVYTADGVIFGLGPDFPQEYRDKDLVEVFELQSQLGASHYEEMLEAVLEAREGTGWYIWSPERGVEVAAWAPVQVGDQVWVIGLSTPLNEILEVSGASQQVDTIRFLMATFTLLVIGVVYLVWHLAGSIARREAAEARFRGVFEAAGDAVFIERLDGVIEDVNRVGCEMLGYTREELVGSNVSMLVPPEVSDSLGSSLDHLLRGERVYVEAENIRKDGAHIPVEVSISPLELADGLHAVVVIRDISKRKRKDAENRLIREINSALNNSARADDVMQLVADGIVETFGVPVCAMLSASEATRYVMIKGLAVRPGTVDRTSCIGKTLKPGYKFPVRENGFWDSYYRRLEPDRVPLRMLTSVLGNMVRETGFPDELERAVSNLMNMASLENVSLTPLSFQGRMRGALVVFYGNETKSDVVDSLEEFAKQVSYMIERAWLYESTAERLRRIEVLALISQRMSSHLDMNKVLEATADGAIELLGADKVGIYLADEIHGSIRAAHARGLSEWYLTKINELYWQLPGRAVTFTEEPFLAPDVLSDPRTEVLRELAKKEGYRSLCVFPMKHRGKVIGGLTLYHSDVRFYSEEDVNLAQTLADRAAMAIGNAMLYEAERQQRQVSDIIREAGMALAATLDPSEMMIRLLEQVRRVVPYDAANVMMIDEDGDTIRIKHLVGYERFGNKKFVSGLTFSLSKTPNLRKMAKTKRAYLIRDVLDYPGWRRIPETNWLRSWVGAPIVLRGEVMGFFSLDSATPGFYTEEHARLLEIFATHAAIALENSRLFQEVRLYAEALEAEVMLRTEEIRRERERMETILHHAADAIILMNLDSKIEYVNPAWELQTGYPVTETLGHPIREVLGYDMTKRELAEMFDVLKSGQVWRGEMELKRADGTRYYADMTIAPITDESGNPVNFVGIMRDITHIKETQRMQTAFIENVSHELRTPLSSIRLYTQLLRQGKQEKWEHYLDRLEREVARLDAIVMGLLDFSRLDALYDNLEARPVRIEQVLRDLLIRHAPRAERKNIKLEVSVEEELPPVRGDVAMVAQAISHLVENALNYTHEGGSVIMRASRHGHEVKVSVEDTGVGVPLGEQPYVFDRFFRGEAAYQMNVPGTGLGLALVKRIAEVHNGRVEMKSTFGKGSVFEVYLPIWEELNSE